MRGGRDEGMGLAQALLLFVQGNTRPHLFARPAGSGAWLAAFDGACAALDHPRFSDSRHRQPQHVQALGVATILIMSGSGFAVQALIRPVYGIALVLFYYDQRIRLEGYDIEWMMQQAGLAPPPGTTAQVPVAVPEAGREPLPWLPVASRLTPAPEDKADSPKTGVEE